VDQCAASSFAKPQQIRTSHHGILDALAVGTAMAMKAKQPLPIRHAPASPQTEWNAMNTTQFKRSNGHLARFFRSFAA